ncbi:MAG TPA: hypothetical protein VFO55_10745 [Gemmatimonadaceae bacterium]|nr:hypothetical protein [Gemmatimonadaceae bacterium]
MTLLRRLNCAAVIRRTIALSGAGARVFVVAAAAIIDVPVGER